MRPRVTGHRATIITLSAAVALAACGTDAQPDPVEAPPTVTSPTPDAPNHDASPTPATTPTENAAGVVIDLTVTGTEVTGADSRVGVPLGEDVTLRITADVDDEIHVHGYDLHQDVTAGQEAELTFTADVPGVFEVELEESGLLLVRLEVS